MHFLRDLTLAQELRAEEDRIYSDWMKAAEAAAVEARKAYHERRRAQLLEVRRLRGTVRSVGSGLHNQGSRGRSTGGTCRLPPSPRPSLSHSQRGAIQGGGAARRRHSAQRSLPCTSSLASPSPSSPPPPPPPPQEARAVVAERRGAALEPIATAQQKEGVFAWPQGAPEAGGVGLLAYNKASGVLRPANVVLVHLGYDGWWLKVGGRCLVICLSFNMHPCMHACIHPWGVGVVWWVGDWADRWVKQLLCLVLSDATVSRHAT